MTVRTDYLDDSEDDDRLIIRHSQDVAPILDNNRRFAQEFDGFTPSRDMQHVATIPLVVLQMWRDRYGPDCVKDRAFLRRMLNDPEWSYLRTGQGRL